MPLYEYECAACGHRFEVIQRFSDAPIEVCPKCNAAVHKLLSAPAIQFKGTGWYVTDYAHKNSTEASSKSGSQASESASDSKSDSDKRSASSKSDSDKGNASSGSSSSSSSDSSATKSETKSDSKPATKTD